jgi:hypothetical protein
MTTFYTPLRWRPSTIVRYRARQPAPTTVVV